MKHAPHFLLLLLSYCWISSKVQAERGASDQYPSVAVVVMTHSRPGQLARILGRISEIGLHESHVVVSHSVSTDLNDGVQPEATAKLVASRYPSSSEPELEACKDCVCTKERGGWSALRHLSYSCTRALGRNLGRHEAKIESTRNLLSGVNFAFSASSAPQLRWADALDSPRIGCEHLIRMDEAEQLPEDPDFVLVVEDDAALSPDLPNAMASARLAASEVASRLDRALGVLGVSRPRRLASRGSANNPTAGGGAGGTPASGDLDRGAGTAHGTGRGGVAFDARGVPWLKLSESSLNRVAGAARAAVERGEATGVKDAVLGLLGVTSGRHLVRPSVVAGLADAPPPPLQADIDAATQGKAEGGGSGAARGALADFAEQPHCLEPELPQGTTRANGPGPALPLRLVGLEGQARLVVKTWAWQVSRQAWEGWLRGDLQRSVAAAVGARRLALGLRSELGGGYPLDFAPRSIGVGLEAGGYYSLLGLLERVDFQDHMPGGLERLRQKAGRRGGRGAHWSKGMIFRRMKMPGLPQPPIDRCMHCEPACYDHVAEHGLHSRGGFLLAPALPRVSQMPGRGMTYDRNPTPALVRLSSVALPGGSDPAGDFELLDAGAAHEWWSFGWFRTPGHSQLAPRWKEAEYARGAVDALMTSSGGGGARLSGGRAEVRASSLWSWAVRRLGGGPAGWEGRRDAPLDVAAALVALEGRQARAGLTDSSSALSLLLEAADLGAWDRQVAMESCRASLRPGADRTGCETAAAELAYRLAGLYPEDEDGAAGAGGAAGPSATSGQLDAEEAQAAARALWWLGPWEIAAWWEWVRVLREQEGEGELSRRYLAALGAWVGARPGAGVAGAQVDMGGAVAEHMDAFVTPWAEAAVWLRLMYREPVVVVVTAVVVLCLLPVGCALSVPVAVGACMPPYARFVGVSRQGRGRAGSGAVDGRAVMPRGSGLTADGVGAAIDPSHDGVVEGSGAGMRRRGLRG